MKQKSNMYVTHNVLKCFKFFPHGSTCCMGTNSLLVLKFGKNKSFVKDFFKLYFFSSDPDYTLMITLTSLLGKVFKNMANLWWV